MNKITTSSLSKKLASYGALTAAIAGVAEAQGQSVIYTDITPDFSGGMGTEYFLDLDNNGTPDFRFHANSGYYGYYGGNLYLQPLTASNEALGSLGSVGSYAYPFALDNGAVISANAAGSWLNNSYMSLNYGGADGNFINVTDKYVGLRFNINGNTHYGWVRIDVGLTGGDPWTVKDYAYADTPNIGIIAGQQTLNADAFTSNNTSIVAAHQLITLYNLPHQSDYKVFGLDGKVVLQGTANSGNEFIIDASAIATGVYMVQLTNEATHAAIIKKIIL